MAVIQLAGGLFGELFCLYAVVLRWEVIRRRYGLIDLIFWLQAMLLFSWLAAYVVEIGVWLLVRSALQ